MEAFSKTRGRMVMRLLYEPWGLGDACIAAAVAASLDGVDLACRTQWHEIIHAALARRGKTLQLISADPDFGIRSLESTGQNGKVSQQHVYSEVLSIRGDPRDYMAMRRDFPGAAITITGWSASLARRIKLFDLLWSQFLPPESRYVQWMDCIASRSVKLPVSIPLPDKIKSVGIHVGAQWRSKQYPHVAQLGSELQKMGLAVEILAGPGDPLPVGVYELNVERCTGRQMVERMAKFDLVITNDSGPMHVAYLAEIPFISLFGTANAAEWAPIGARYLAASFMPSGYKSLSCYGSDLVLSGWPPPNDIISQYLSTN